MPIIPAPAAPSARKKVAGRRRVTRPRVAAAERKLTLEEDALELVLLAGLEDREHLVARLQLGRPDGDLCSAVPHDGDQARPFRKRELLDLLAGAGGALVDLHLDDLEV